jgi:hypothetical protein
VRCLLMIQVANHRLEICSEAYQYIFQWVYINFVVLNNYHSGNARLVKLYMSFEVCVLCWICSFQYISFSCGIITHTLSCTCFSVASKMKNYQSFSMHVVLQSYNLKYDVMICAWLTRKHSEIFVYFRSDFYLN